MFELVSLASYIHVDRGTCSIVISTVLWSMQYLKAFEMYLAIMLSNLLKYSREFLRFCISEICTISLGNHQTCCLLQHIEVKSKYE